MHFPEGSAEPVRDPYVFFDTGTQALGPGLALRTIRGATSLPAGSDRPPGHHTNQVRAVFGIRVQIAVQTVGRHHAIRNRASREIRGQRAFIGCDAEDAAIARTRAFYESIGIKTRLADYEVSAAVAPKVAARLAARGMTALGERGDLTPARIESLLRAAA